MEAAEKHYFVCANTAEGFVDHFRSNLADLDRIFILKGGSGTGKSTLMTRIGKAYQACDYAVDYIHCSSDADSLDGVIIPDLSVAIVDGTSPHVVEPVLPGAIEDYVNLGLALDRKKLAPYKDKMLAIKKEISMHYKAVYDYLHQAAIVLEKSEVTVTDMPALAADKQQQLFEQILGKTVLLKKAKVKHRFCGALTAKGDVYPGLDIAKACEKRCFLNGRQTDRILHVLAETALAHGYDVEIYHDHFRSDKVIFLTVPEQSLCVLSQQYPSVKKLRRSSDSWYDLDALGDAPVQHVEKIPTPAMPPDCAELIQKASDALSAAHKAHSALEQFYYPAVDFEIVEQIHDAIRAEIDTLG